MEPLLILALYIFAAIALAWLVHWGGGKYGATEPFRTIVAGIVFVLVLLYGLNQTGVLAL
jgi:hypothetical protein